MNSLIPILFLSLFLMACPKRLPGGGEGAISDVAELRAAVEAADQKLVSLEGDGRLKVDSPEGKGAAQVFVAVARPALLHVEVLDFFGKPMALLVSDGTGFGFYDAKTQRFFRGPATAENLSRFLPVALPPAQLVRLFLGEPPRLDSEDTGLRFNDKRGVYEWTLRRPSHTQTLEVDPKRFRVSRTEVKGEGGYEALFEEPQRYGDAWLPQYLTLKSPSAKASLELRYTSVKVNERVDLTMFEPVAPDGATVTEVDASGRPTKQGETLPSLPLSNE